MGTFHNSLINAEREEVPPGRTIPLSIDEVLRGIGMGHSVTYRSFADAQDDTLVVILSVSDPALALTLSGVWEALVVVHQGK